MHPDLGSPHSRTATRILEIIKGEGMANGRPFFRAPDEDSPLNTADTVTTLAKSHRTDKETFYLLTMTADLSRPVRMGGSMTEEECRSFFKERGMPDIEITGHIDNARLMLRQAC
jgi:hypothetical protein